MPNSRQEQTFTAHLTPMHFIEHTLHGIYNVPDSNGLAGENKGIYKYVQNVHTGTMKREGNRNYPRGFDQGCLDMVQYLHKNLDY